MIVVGDLSGIQTYLFDVADAGGGQARRLRARSFFLQVIADLAAIRIVREFGWSFESLRMAGAGKFLLQGPAPVDADLRLGRLEAAPTADIQQAFPGIRGFSPGNVWRMRAFFLAYRSTQPILAQPARELARDTKVAQVVRKVGESLSAQPVPKSKRRSLAQAARETAESIQSQVVTQLNVPILPQAVAEIPWGHNVILVEKVKDADQRLWYAAKTLEHGWSRAVLTVQIESDLFGRHGKAISNFTGTLPAPQSDLAQQALKDPYLFDFLTLHDEAMEHDLERGLVDQIQKFLLELGAGFAFVGRQVQIVVGDEEFYIDLLFYHLKLRCFFIIDLKMRKFTPEDAGKMNFSLSPVDSQLRHPDDAPSIGPILCKTRDRITAEYALFRLTSSDSISGPLSLGYANHFGMGRFVPAGDPPDASASVFP